MPKKIEKNETIITIALIIIYLVSNSFCLNTFGSNDYRTAICNILLSTIIILFILLNRLVSYYKLDKIPNPKKFLYFIPLIILMSVNLWHGISINNTIDEIIIHIINMIGIGFLEEIIFRGFLFQMLAKDNIKTAIIVTSLTFGVGHIINLLNGADIIPTLIQICYATATGYLFAIILYKGKSLWPCIITHIVVNSLSIFNTTTVSVLNNIGPIALIVVSLSYAIYINKTIKE